MNYYDPVAILEVLKILNATTVPYLLLRNTGDELPDRLEWGKDIDILVRYEDRLRLRGALLENKLRQERHPLHNDLKLYGVHQFESFKSQKQVLLDVSYEIAVRSLDQGQWIPLDREIQLSAWAHSQIVDICGVKVPMLGNEDLWVCTLARCIFDKKNFSPWHRQMLSELLLLVDPVDIEEKLRLVFFKYTDRLFLFAKNGDYQNIYDDYVSFKDY